MTIHLLLSEVIDNYMPAREAITELERLGIFEEEVLACARDSSSEISMLCFHDSTGRLVLNITIPLQDLICIMRYPQSCGCPWEILFLDVTQKRIQEVSEPITP